MNGGVKLTGPAAGLLVGTWLSAAPVLKVSWLPVQGYSGSGFVLPEKLPKAETEEPNVSGA